MDASWAPVVGAGLGAAAVLVSQLISWMSSGRRQKLDLEQRDREARLRYLEPLRDKSFDALEKFHELLQDVLESGSLYERDYLAVRPYFAYVNDDLRAKLLSNLTIIATSAESLSPERRRALLDLQDAIRENLRTPDIREFKS